VKRVLSRLAFAVTLLAVPLVAQEAVQQSGAPPGPPPRVPFGVGELLEYDISYGKIHVGNGNMEVLPMDTVRGRQTYQTIFRLRGGIPFYRVNDRYEDWLDAHSLATLRSHQDIDEGPYEPKRRFEIFPELREYIENDKEPRPSVEHPLDEGSFLYFLRTIPLRVGMDTSFNDYFRADRNPVRFKVLRKDTIEVDAGRFAALVVQPIFYSKLFSEGGQAEVWLSDDENHIMLQMKSKVRFGSLSLFLKSYRPSPTATAPLNRLPKR
jgi:hypothetical protein